ncbi:MAG: serine hydrolase domain-containing protein [Cyclobacteriaceae bacterium]
MEKILSVLFITTLLISCNQKQASVENPQSEVESVKDSLTSELNEIQSNGVINGFSVAIVSEGNVLYQHGFGFADISNKTRYSENTLQNIASVSKSLIGIALLKAQEMGNLNLDDPISKFLTFDVRNPNFPDQEITIRHLATHTSSITDGDIYGEKSYILKDPRDSIQSDSMKIPEDFNPPSDNTSMQLFLESLLSEKGEWYSQEVFLNKPPGQLFEYTNLGATLAALVLESATEEKYSEFTKKHILGPLKMESSGWYFDEIDFSRHTKLYASTTEQIPFYSLITYPDGGLITSINDLSKYLVELIRGYSGKGSLLTEASYSELYKLQLGDENFEERDAENPYNDEYNFGIFIGFSAQDYVGHTGGDPGVSSFMFFNTKNKIGRILLINTDLTSEEGVQQFFSIWNKLEEYQQKLN